VPAVRFKELSNVSGPTVESSEEIQARVIAARERQLGRLVDDGIFANAQMTPRICAASACWMRRASGCWSRP